MHSFVICTIVSSNDHLPRISLRRFVYHLHNAFICYRHRFDRRFGATIWLLPRISFHLDSYIICIMHSIVICIISIVCFERQWLLPRISLHLDSGFHLHNAFNYHMHHFDCLFWAAITIATSLVTSRFEGFWSRLSWLGQRRALPSHGRYGLKQIDHRVGRGRARE